VHKKGIKCFVLDFDEVEFALQSTTLWCLVQLLE